MNKTFQMYLCVGVASYNNGDLLLTQNNPDTLELRLRHAALIKEVEITIEVPENIDFNALKLSALETQLETERADSQLRQNFLLDQISKLKCLTHDEVVG